jgi:hypothetical protein
LTCQSNRFSDASNTYTLTVTGTPSVVAFSPFNPTASWSAATYGGSGYFDGSGDSLTCSSILPATSDFTLSFWVYPTSLAGYVVGGAIRQADSGNIFQFFLGYTDGRPSIQIGGVYNDFTAGTIKANQWHYIQLVKASSAYTLYVNGTALSVTASNGNIGTTSIASGTFYVQYNTGCYFSDVRVVASALSNTVPTAPLTAITNTSLLLNFTNAGIYDATSKNDLETVGNAQISTAVSAKWGTGSIYMAAATANTDYLVTPASRNVQLGSGDFTIEFWMRPDSVTTSWANGSLATMLDLDPGAGTGTDWWFIHQVNNTLQFGTNGAAILTSSASLVATTWQYIALVRSGSGSNNLTFYINGSSSGSATYTSTIGGNRRLFIGTQNGSTRWYKGYIQDLRITPGVARVITTPTAAFPTL